MKKFVFLLFCLSLISSAQITPPPLPDSSTPQQLPDHPIPQTPAPVDPTKPADYSQEAYIVNDFRYIARFENDGRGTKTFEADIKIQSDAGVQQWGQLVFGYNSANEKLEIGYVRVKKADGNIITATKDSVQDLSAGVARFAPMYTDYRQKHITVPSLRPGDTLQYSIITTTETALAPNQFWFSYDFDRNIIVLNESLEVSVPKDKKIKLKTETGFEPTISTVGDRKVYVWKSSNLKRKTDEELRKEFRKRRLRKSEDQPAIQLTTFQSWEEVGKWYAPLQKERVQPTPELKAKALELTKNKKDPAEKVRAIYEYVAPEIRYVSLSFGVGRFQPHAASEIFANKYGDCKDKHTLLSSMLLTLGIHTDPVLINSVRQLDPDIPSPAQFDHVISMVSLGGDQKIWLDTTAEVAPFELLSWQLRKKKALWVPAEGKAQVVETPADSPVPNQQLLTINGKVNEIGTLNADVKFVFRGDSELTFRSAFRNAAESEWKNIAGNLGLKGEASEISISNPADFGKPFELNYKLSIANFMAWSSKTPSIVVPLPQVSIPEVDDDDDDQPDQIDLSGSPVECDFKMRLEVPEKYTVGVPVPATVKRDYGTYTVQYGNEKNVITAERKLVLNLRDLPKTRLGDYLAFRRIVFSDQAQQISLETKSASGATLPAGLKADDLIAAGGAALQNQNFQAAVDSYKRALELEPKNKAAYRGLGAAYLNLQKKDDAIATFKKLLEINPYDEYAWTGIGYAYGFDHDYANAAEAFRKQVEINPLDATAQLSLASVLVQLRRFEDARPEMEKASQLMPRNSEVQASLGQIYLELKQPEKALAAFEKAVEFGANATVWNNVAYELAQHNLQLDRAQQYAESAVTEIATQLRNIDVQRLRIDDFRRVNAISSYWDTLGWVHFRRGDVAQAKKFIESAWLLGPNGEVAYHLGEILEKEGQKDKAIQMYAAAAGVKRAYAPARQKLETVLGDKKKAEATIKEMGQKYSKPSTLELGPLSKDDGQADFAFVFAPGRVDGVKFLGGDDKLKGLDEKLATLKYQVGFPDSTPTKLARRGTVSCKNASCTLTWLAAEEVISAE